MSRDRAELEIPTSSCGRSVDVTELWRLSESIKGVRASKKSDFCRLNKVQIGPILAAYMSHFHLVSVRPMSQTLGLPETPSLVLLPEV